MTLFGYTMMCEQAGPKQLVRDVVLAEEAGFDFGVISGLGEFVLPCRWVRTAEDPDATLLSFFQSTYEAAAEVGGWPRATLEAGPVPRP